jgi:hypothetical protein
MYRIILKFFLTTAFGIAFILVTPLCEAAPVCFLGTVQCFLWCGNPPRIGSVEQADAWLRPAEYGKLNWIDQTTAIFTTQMFKCFGINGWKRYRIPVWATGTVKQAATSWDGLRTVDIELENFNGRTSDELCGRRFIRAEVIRRVWSHIDHPPCPGDHLRVHGELHWDGHGFLEIHPSKETDINFLPNTAPPTTCSAPHNATGLLGD